MINDILNEADAARWTSRSRRPVRSSRRSAPDAPTRACSTRSWSTTTAPRRRCSSSRRSPSPEARIILIAPYDMGAMGAIEKAIRDSDLGVNPANDGKMLRCVFPELTEERRKEYIKVAKAQGRGRPGRRCATSAVTPSRTSRSSRRTARSARTTSPAPRSGSTGMTKTAHRRDRRAAQAQGSRAARGLSSPPMTDAVTPPADAAEGPRPRRPRPPGRHRLRRRAARRDRCCRCCFWKTAFMVIVAAAVVVAIWELHRGCRAKDIDLPEQPLMLGGVVMVVVAYFFGAPGAGDGHRASTALVTMLWLLRRGVDGYVQNATASVFTLIYVPFLGSFVALLLAEGGAVGLRPLGRRASGASSPSSWSPSPPTSAATSPACCSASTRWRR